MYSIFYILEQSVFNVVIHFSRFIMPPLMNAPFIFRDCIFYGKVALRSIRYARKMLVVDVLAAEMFRVKLPRTCEVFLLYVTDRKMFTSI